MSVAGSYSPAAVRGVARAGLLDDAGPAPAGGGWCDLAQTASLFLRTPYLTYAMTEPFDSFRLEAHQADRVVAGATGWIADGRGHDYLEPASILAGLGVRAGRSLVLGCPGAFRGEVAIAPEIDRTPDAAGAAEALADAACSYARDNDLCGAVALYLDDRSAAFLSRCHTASPLALMNFDTAIPVPDSFEAYLDTFEYRRSREIRREMKRFADAGLVCSVEISDASIRELAPILAASEIRHGHSSSAEAVAATLFAQRRHLGEDGLALFIARNAEGVMVAGAVAFLDDTTVHMRVCGVDPKIGGGTFAYFNTTYYAPISYAAQTGRRRVQLGMESFDAKLARGARVEPRWGLALGAPTDIAAAWRAATPAWNRSRLAMLESWAMRSRPPFDAETRDAILRRAEA